MNKYNNISKVYDGINFKSKLEISCYKKLKEEGFNPKYEEKKFIIFNGFKLSPKVFYFTQFKKKFKGEIKSRNVFANDNRKLRDITYLPDFYFPYKDYEIYFDTKGMPNDVYPLKKKMFLDMLNKVSLKTNKQIIFFEPHSVKQIKEAIEIIKNL